LDFSGGGHTYFNRRAVGDKPEKNTLAMRCAEILDAKLPDPRVKSALEKLSKQKNLDSHVREYCKKE